MAAAQPEYDYAFKVLVIGDSAVGKSSLILRFADDTYDTSYIATIGVDFKVKTVDVDGKRCKMMLWDTAGQERFAPITSSYYRGAMGFLVVYDVTDRQSFTNVRRWIEEMKKYGAPDVPWLLIGNKSDASTKRVVAFDEAQELADELDVKFLETSAKHAHNVEKAFFTMTQEVLATKAQACLRARPSRAEVTLTGHPVSSRGRCCV